MKKLVLATAALLAVAAPLSAFAAPPATSAAHTTTPKEHTTKGTIDTVSADSLKLKTGTMFKVKTGVATDSFKTGDKVSVRWTMQGSDKLADTIKASVTKPAAPKPAAPKP
jgi:Cu/Ag efflux protein CusF